MASKKKRTEEDITDENGDEFDGLDDEFEDESDENEEDVEMTNATVQVEFEARNAEDCDFPGIRKLLQQLFLKANLNVSQLTDTIISQNYIGSVIKQAYLPEEDDSGEDDEDDVFGVISVINITERKKEESIQQLRSFIIDKCSDCSSKQGGGKEKRDMLAEILDSPDHQVGLLLNERFINIPPQIALPSFESLWKETDRAVSRKMKYDFSHLLMLCKMYKSEAGPIFVNAEEELFSQASVMQFEYSVAGEHDAGVGGQWDEEDEEMEPWRRVLVIPRHSVVDVMEKMTSLLAMPGT